MSAITREKFLVWAEVQVKLHPTYTASVLDAAQRLFVEAERSNSVEREWASILLRRAAHAFEDCTQRELRDYLAEHLWDGVKGYAQMTRDELLVELLAMVPDYLA